MRREGKGTGTDGTGRTTGSGAKPRTRGESYTFHPSQRSQCPASSEGGPPGFIPPHGGYRALLSYRKAEIVYDATVRFCRRFLDRRDRTVDQMVQAARSGKQNISEGSQASGTSKEMEIKLTNVARASLEELLRDYHDYLRNHDLPLWDKNSRAARAVRRLGRQDDETFETYRHYVEERSDGTVANMVICLIHQANYLLDRQLQRLERDFLDQGGMRERMTRARIERRGRQGFREDAKDYRTEADAEEDERRPSGPSDGGSASYGSYGAAQPADRGTDHRTDTTNTTDRTEDRNARPQQPSSSGDGGSASYRSYESYGACGAAQYKPYPAYKPSGVEWLGDVPEHWGAKRLKFTHQLQTTKAGDGVRHDFRVALENLESWTGRYFETESDFAGDGVFFAAGDVLFGKLRPYLAKVWLADRDGEALGDFYVLKPEPEVFPRFSFYVLLSRGFIDVVNSSTYGTKMPRANWDFVGNMVPALPPLPEQRAIADFLDRETGRIDALVAKKRRLIELLEEKRSALISHAVTKGLDPNVPMKDSGIDWLGKIPAHWGRRKFRYLCRMISGGTPSKSNPEFWRGNIPWVSPKDMKLEVICDSQDHISRAALSSLALITPPSVLIVVRGMILAHTFPVGLGTVPLTINQDMKALKPSSEVDAAFLASLLRGLAPAMLALVEDSAHGTKCLRTDVFDGIEVFLPPLEEQRKILCGVQERTTRLDALLAKNSEVIDKLQEYRTALISAAVTGKIDVREEVECA